MNEKRVEEILDRIGGLFNEGAQLTESVECGLHPTSFVLEISNQGGFDCTNACLACVEELIAAVRE